MRSRRASSCSRAPVVIITLDGFNLQSQYRPEILARALYRCQAKQP